MKSAAILCPGPSLSRIDPFRLDDFDVRIGVNRAPLILWNSFKYPCDWWAFGDCRVLEKFAPPFTGKLYTMDCAVAGIQQFSGPKPDKLYEDLFAEFGREVQWTLYTSTAALVLAAHLGAKSIHVFGADMAGTSDADGFIYEWNNGRTPDRWAEEKRFWADTVKMLSSRGVQVIRD